MLLNRLSSSIYIQDTIPTFMPKITISLATPKSQQYSIKVNKLIQPQNHSYHNKKFIQTQIKKQYFLTICGWGQDFLKKQDKLDCLGFRTQVLANMAKYEGQILLASILSQISKWFQIYGVKKVCQWVFVVKEHSIANNMSINNQNNQKLLILYLTKLSQKSPLSIQAQQQTFIRQFILMFQSFIPPINNKKLNSIKQLQQFLSQKKADTQKNHNIYRNFSLTQLQNKSSFLINNKQRSSFLKQKQRNLFQKSMIISQNYKLLSKQKQRKLTSISSFIQLPNKTTIYNTIQTKFNMLHYQQKSLSKPIVKFSYISPTQNKKLSHIRSPTSIEQRQIRQHRPLSYYSNSPPFPKNNMQQMVHTKIHQCTYNKMKQTSTTLNSYQTSCHYISQLSTLRNSCTSNPFSLRTSQSNNPLISSRLTSNNKPRSIQTSGKDFNLSHKHLFVGMGGYSHGKVQQLEAIQEMKRSSDKCYQEQQTNRSQLYPYTNHTIKNDQYVNSHSYPNDAYQYTNDNFQMDNLQYQMRGQQIQQIQDQLENLFDNSENEDQFQKIIEQFQDLLND